MIRTKVLKQLQGAGKREDEAKEISREEQLPEEQSRRVGVSGLLTGRRPEMTQLNASFPQGSEVPLESHRE